jgi:hypothetical protein
MFRFEDYSDSGRRGYAIAREIFDSIVTTLRKDPRIRAVVSRDDLDLLVADTLRATETRLIREFRGRVHVEEFPGADDAEV